MEATRRQAFTSFGVMSLGGMMGAQRLFEESSLRREGEASPEAISSLMDQFSLSLKYRRMFLNSSTPDPSGIPEAVLDSYQVDELRESRSRLKESFGGLGEAKISINPVNSEVSGESLTLTVREVSASPYLVSSPQDLEVSEEVNYYCLQGVQYQGKWVLTDYSVMVPNPYMLPAVASGCPLIVDAPLKRGGVKSWAWGPSDDDPSKVDPAELALDTRLLKYDYNAMAAYGIKYGSAGTAPDYPDWGTNCTNFVSQCLRAGGWAQVRGELWQRGDKDKWWCSLIPGNVSYSWSAVNNLHWFAFESKRVSHLGNIFSMKAGDFIQYDYNPKDSQGWDHSQPCVGRDSRGPIVANWGGRGHCYSKKSLREVLKSNKGSDSWYKYAHRT